MKILELLGDLIFKIDRYNLAMYFTASSVSCYSSTFNQPYSSEEISNAVQKIIPKISIRNA